MAKTRFEQLIDDEKRNVADSTLKLANGDSHGLAEAKGMSKGLTKAVELFRQTLRVDSEQD